jgi:hypothetical protein
VLRADAVRLSAPKEQTPLLERRQVIELTLKKLTQVVPSGSERADRSQILTTAELYRLASMLYLQRACPAVSDEADREMILTAAFQCVSQLEVVTSPWPVYIFACESKTDERRMSILKTLNKMENLRGLGNLFDLRGVIEGIWCQADLRADGNGTSRFVKWWEIVNCEHAMPWFI